MEVDCESENDGGGCYQRGHRGAGGRGNIRGRGNWRRNGRGHFQLNRGGHNVRFQQTGVYHSRPRGRSSVYRGVSSRSNGGQLQRSMPPPTISTSPTPPPPPRKRVRLDNSIPTTIMGSVMANWKVIIPGYDLYFGKYPPILHDTEDKFNAFVKYLLKTDFEQHRVICEASRDAVYCGIEEEFFYVLYEDVLKDEEFCSLWKDFGDDLFNEPEATITLCSAAAHKVITKAPPQANAHPDLPLTEHVSKRIVKIHIGIFKPKPITALSSIKSSCIGKFITIRGVVVKCTNVRHKCTTLTFQCKLCNGKFTLEQAEGKFTVPKKCLANVDCSQKSSFEKLESEATTIVMDYREITIREVEQSDIERGSIPKTFNCILYGVWIDKCSAGDVISLSGIVKMSSSTIITGVEYNSYVEVSAIQQSEGSGENKMAGDFFTFTDKDYIAIKAIHDEPNLFALLVWSFCPSIYGNDIVKAGLLLSLFCGTKQNVKDVPVRNDINVLMVGDPGMGKSVMLKFCTKIAPKAVYVCGSASSTAGLTISLTKDGNNDYTLEPGALVISNGGTCCIDEFDKMKSQHNALLETMEQGTVSVCKAGIHRTLPAKTSVLAAANPVKGHYEETKSVSENLNINPAVLSRFDLIFILQDKPSKEFDTGLIAHKNKLRGIVHQSVTSNIREGTSMIPNETTPHSSNSAKTTLMDQIKTKTGQKVDIIPPELIRKYIAYAKRWVHPQLSTEAKEVLKKYFLTMRTKRFSFNSTPITARQLEALVRLSQARAKVELRETVTAKDASDVLEIFEFSQSSVSGNDGGGIKMAELLQNVSLNDVTSVTTQSSISPFSSSSSLNMTSRRPKVKSTNAQAKQLMDELQQLSIQQSKNIFSYDEIKRVISFLGYADKTDVIISTLNTIGVLLMKGGSTYMINL